MLRKLCFVSVLIIFTISCTKSNAESVLPNESDWRWKYTSIYSEEKMEDIYGIEITSLDCNYPKELIIPNSIGEQNVISIGAYAFFNRGDKGNRIESVTLPDGLLKIGEYAFAGNQLANVTFPEGLLIIEPYAFMSNKINKAYLPWTIQSVCWSSFVANGIWDDSGFIEEEIFIQHKEFEKFNDVEPIFYTISIKNNGKTIYLPANLHSWNGWGAKDSRSYFTLNKFYDLLRYYNFSGQREGIYTHQWDVELEENIWKWNSSEE